MIFVRKRGHHHQLGTEPSHLPTSDDGALEGNVGVNC